MIFDRQITSTPTDFTSVAGTVEIGHVAADEIQRLLKEKNGAVKGKVLQVLGDPADPYTLDIQKGFEEKMKAFPDVKIISPAGHAVGGVERRQHRRRPAAGQPRHRSRSSSMPRIWRSRRSPRSRRRARSRATCMLVSSNGAPVGLDLIRKGWEQVEVEQPLFAQAAALAMFADKVVEQAGDQARQLQGARARSRTLTIESWGPNIKIPGAAITKANVDDPGFWGNMKTPPSRSRR